MDAATRSLSPIEGLPRELMWSIIEYATETTGKLRMASSVTKAHVDEFAVQRDIIRLVREVVIRRPSAYNNAGVFEISVYVPNNKTSIFELRFKQFGFPELFKSKINRYSPSKIDGCHEYQFDVKLEHDEVTWLDCLSEWIGKSVHSVHFMIEEFESEPCALAISLMEKLKFTRFTLTSSQCCEETVKTFFTPQLLSQLQAIVVEVRTVPDPEKFLLYLSDHVPDIKIHQLSTNGVRNGGDFFLGLLDYDWVPVFLEMYSRKVDKLMIINDRYKGYLPMDSSEELRGRLPLIGKAIWFEANCSNYGLNHMEKVENDHQLSVVQYKFYDIILDMLTRRLDKLHIHETSYAQYLPDACVDFLRDRIPKLGKKIWLDAKYDQKHDYVDNEHRVQTFRSSYPSLEAKLTITHTTREAEK